MRKWRPTHKSLYVIPEVRGNMETLEVILNRILPLRKHIHQEDMLVFLGDYIDGDKDSDKVIDCLINIKEEYKDRVILLRGNHEEMLLSAFNSDHYFTYWTDNGGYSTIEAYVNRSGVNSTPYAIKSNRLFDLIPKQHIEFIKSLDYYKILDDYCFFHGGFDPSKSIDDNSLGNFVYDFTSSKYLKDCIKHKKEPIFKDNYIFVGNHNYLGEEPFIHSKYFMLGGMAPGKLIAFELNSMTASAATKGKSRIYKYNFRTFES
jgi:hypothetical protein